MVVKDRLPGERNDQRFKRKGGEKKTPTDNLPVLGHCSLVL